jgi:hypothetical protein
MFKPSVDDIIDRMRWLVDNYDDAHTRALGLTDKIQTEYDWDTLTSDAFGNLEKRLPK